MRLGSALLSASRPGLVLRQIAGLGPCLQPSRDNSAQPRKKPNSRTSLNHLALLYHTQGRCAKAEPRNPRTLAIREKVFGPEHRNTVTVRENYTVLLEIISAQNDKQAAAAD